MTPKLETSRPKLVSNLRSRTASSADQNECGMEIPLQQSRPRVMRTRRIKAEKDRSVGVCDNPISNACNINVEIEDSLAVPEKDKLNLEKGGRVDLLTHDGGSMYNTEKKISTETFQENTEEFHTSEDTFGKLIRIENIVFPVRKEKNEKILHSAFRNVNESQKEQGNRGRLSFSEDDDEIVLRRGEHNRKSKDSLIKKCQPEFSDDVCDFVDEYQNIDMLFGDV